MSNSVTSWTVAHQALLSMGFFRQEYWSGLLCPSRGDLPDTGIKPASLTCPALAGWFFTTGTTWRPGIFRYCKVTVDFPHLCEETGKGEGLWECLLVNHSIWLMKAPCFVVYKTATTAILRKLQSRTKENKQLPKFRR